MKTKRGDEGQTPLILRPFRVKTAKTPAAGLIAGISEPPQQRIGQSGRKWAARRPHFCSARAQRRRAAAAAGGATMDADGLPLMGAGIDYTKVCPTPSQPLPLLASHFGH